MCDTCKKVAAKIEKEIEDDGCENASQMISDFCKLTGPFYK